MSNNGFSSTKKSQVYHKTDGHCAYCGDWLDPFTNWNIDHIIPQSKGGTHHIDNLLPACKKCNCIKRDRSIDEFREYLRYRTISELAKTFRMVEHYGLKQSHEEFKQLLRAAAVMVRDNGFAFFIDYQEEFASEEAEEA